MFTLSILIISCTICGSNEMTRSTKWMSTCLAKIRTVLYPPGNAELNKSSTCASCLDAMSSAMDAVQWIWSCNRIFTSCSQWFATRNCCCCCHTYCECELDRESCWQRMTGTCRSCSGKWNRKSGCERESVWWRLAINAACERSTSGTVNMTSKGIVSTKSRNAWKSYLLSNDRLKIFRQEVNSWTSHYRAT